MSVSRGENETAGREPRSAGTSAATSAPESASARPGEHASVELDELALAGAVGRELGRRDNSAVWVDERVLRWMADDVRADGGGDSRRWSDARVLHAGERLRARVLARRLGVAPLHRRPERRTADVTGSPCEVLDEAAQMRSAPAVDLAVAAGVGRELWDEPCESWIALPPDTPRGRYVAVTIAGDSMTPLLHTGDTVLVRRGTPVKRDTVVVARHPDDGYLCKRVRRVTRTTIELDSLAPDRPLVVIPRDERLIVGTVVLAWCMHDGTPRT